MRRFAPRMFTLCSAASLVVWVLLSLVFLNSYTIPGEPGGPHFYFRAWPTDWRIDSVGHLLHWPRGGTRFSVGTFLFFATAVLPVTWALGFVVTWPHRSLRRHRLAAGCCVKCGYDLRASPGRCPECGAAAASGDSAG